MAPRGARIATRFFPLFIPLSASSMRRQPAPKFVQFKEFKGAKPSIGLYFVYV
jgi:hypothetical protein